MKKMISILLVLVLSLGMLSGISLAAEKPAEATEADAGVVVTFAGSSDKYYFESMTPALLKWACQEMPGAPTFTLLKDLELVNPSEGGSRFFTMPQSNSEWYSNKRPTQTGKLPVTFDLNGKTMSYEGSATLFRFDRYGATFKNGTIQLTPTASRGMFALGGGDVAVATSDGKTIYAPELVLDNVTCISQCDKGSAIVYTYLYASTITVTDSVLWNNGGNAICMMQSTQAGVQEGWTVYEGAYNPTLNLTNSVVGSGGSYPLTGIEEAGAKVNVKDSIFLSNHSTGGIHSPKYPFDLTATSEVEGFTMEGNGMKLEGKANIIGANPLKVELPFTDVKESDWFYSFVSEMYGKKIIAGQTATTFNPNGNLTYGAALKLLTVGVTGKDVGNASGAHWATNYLNEAVAAGWTTIGADKLDAPVTREAFCEIAAKAKGLTEKAENPFKDTNNDAVLALVKAGVISGMSADTFNPTGVLTRAQIAKIISLLIKL